MGELIFWAIVVLLGPGIFVFFFGKGKKVFLIMLGAAFLSLAPMLYDAYSEMQSFSGRDGGVLQTIIMLLVIGLLLLGGLLLLASMGVVAFFSWLRSKNNNTRND